MLSRKGNITKKDKEYKEDKVKKTNKTNNTRQKIQSKTYRMGALGRGNCIINQIRVKFNWLGAEGKS